MSVTPATVVLLTLAFVAPVVVLFMPFVIQKDEDLRLGTFFGAVAVIAMFAMGLAALHDDIERSLTNAASLEKSCPR